MIVTNDYKFSSNINEVIRAGFFGVFFHYKISRVQNRLQRTKIKEYAQKTSKKKKLLIRLFAFCASILLVLLVKTKSLNGLKETIFYVFIIPTKLDFICTVLV